jgi:hypothetical protein
MEACDQQDGDAAGSGRRPPRIERSSPKRGAGTEVAQAPAAWMTRPISRLGRYWASPHQMLPARNTAKPVSTGQRLP